MAVCPIFPREAVEMSLPVLLPAPNRVKSPALYEITYIGPLYQWLSFEPNVKATMPARWSPIVTEHSLGPCDIRQEEVYVANETGLQGRFEHAKLLERSSGPKAWTFASMTSSQLGLAIVRRPGIPLVSYTDMNKILQGKYISSA